MRPFLIIFLVNNIFFLGDVILCGGGTVISEWLLTLGMPAILRGFCAKTAPLCF